MQPVTERRETAGRRREAHGIAIDPEELDRRVALEDTFGVPPVAECPVDVTTTRSRPKIVQDLFDHDRVVVASALSPPIRTTATWREPKLVRRHGCFTFDVVGYAR